MAEATPTLVLVKQDGSRLTRIEAEKELWDKCKTSHVMRRMAWGQYGLENQFTWKLKPTSVTHWILDELIRKKLISGDQIGVQPELESDDSYFNSFVQRLSIFVQDGQALMPKESEGIRMSDFQQNSPPNGQVPPGYTPPPPPMGFPAPGQQMGQPQFPQQPQQFGGPPPGQFQQPPQQPAFPQQAPPGFPPQAPPQFGAPPQQAPQFAQPPGQPSFPPQGPPSAPPGFPQAGPPPQQMGAPQAPPAAAPSDRRRKSAAAAAPAAAPQGAPPQQMAFPQAQQPPGFGAPPGMPQPQFGGNGQSAPPQFGAPAQAAQPSHPQVDNSGVIAELKTLVATQSQQIGQLLQMASQLLHLSKGTDAAVSIAIRGIYEKSTPTQASQLSTEATFKEIGLPYPS